MISKLAHENFANLNSKAFYGYLKSNLNNESIYISLGYLPDSEHADFISATTIPGFTPSELSDSDEFIGGDSEVYDIIDASFYSQNAVTMHRLYNGGITRVLKRVDWTSGTRYRPWPHNDSYVLVKEYQFGVATYNVYQCIFSPNSASTETPSGQLFTPLTLSDGYVWKYMYSIDATRAFKFLSDEWMPTIDLISGNLSDYNVGTDEYTLYTNQKAAVAFTAYSFYTNKTDEEFIEYLRSSGLSTDFNQTRWTKEFTGVDHNEFSPISTGDVNASQYKIDITYDSDSINESKFTYSLKQSGTGYYGPAWLQTFDSDTGTNSELIDLVVNVAPGAGHSSDVAHELNVKNIMINIKNIPQPDEKLYDLMNNSKFNIVSLIDKPIDANTNTYAKSEYYIACRALVTDTLNTFQPGDTLYVGGNSLEVYVVAVEGGDSDADRKIYYTIPNYADRYTSITVGDTVEHEPANSSVTKTNNVLVSRLYNRETIYDKESYIMSDYDNVAIERSVDQIENLSFVINFE